MCREIIKPDTKSFIIKIYGLAASFQNIPGVYTAAGGDTHAFNQLIRILKFGLKVNMMIENIELFLRLSFIFCFGKSFQLKYEG